VIWVEVPLDAGEKQLPGEASGSRETQVIPPEQQYRFEVREELTTFVEVMAQSEQEARARLLSQAESVTLYETLRSDPCILLRSVGSG